MADSFPRLRPWSRPTEALGLLLSGATARTCLPVALVVGTALSLVNQGDVVAHGMAGLTVALKVVANYAIPFLTSSIGALLAVRDRSRAAAPAPRRRRGGPHRRAGRRLTPAGVVRAVVHRLPSGHLVDRRPEALDGQGGPVHTDGASPVPGLHWMGLPWQTRLNSSIIDGVDRDARAVADRVGRALTQT